MAGRRGDSKVKSAGRALDLVDLVAERGSVTFQDVVDSGIPKSSAHGLLATLVDSGWLEHSPETRRYRLGLHAWQVGHAYDGHRKLLEASQQVMDDLSARVGETVQLARLEGIENVYIAIRLSPKPMRMASSVGMRLHAHATGIGKALLGTLDPAEARRRLASVALPRLTANTVTDVDELGGVVARARELGFAVDDEEFIEGCRCVAVPVTTEAETGVSAAMSITMPTSRTDERWPHSMYPMLRDSADRIRRQMGLAGSLSP
ncbi:IclR family transcriptional regulator [Georgenia alba]|uniref:IclR family transcriptional regulator n=1 Tax=Georgenia alba TaxID=2233858 RepID=A0ABW2Q2V7_9MICO